MDHLHDLLKRFATLERAPRTSKGAFPASRSPYKPVLLVGVLRRIQQKDSNFAENKIRFQSCLSDFSRLYSGLYGDADAMSVKATQAFWYLGTGKPQVWELVPHPGHEEELKELCARKFQLKSAPRLNRLISFARFSNEDWTLLQDTDVQKALISFLIAEQFTDIRRELDRL